ncbi:ribosome maturation factor RimP [Roseateles sp. DAIF2]|nr:ribosome maturation factor RimP [Roseateles sp. DAIF2]
MSWQAAVEKTVTGLGYDLVDCERSAAGLLRVYIDKLAEQATAGEVITVDDCEKVTRQLQYVLEVENTDYQRLEVSSPGLDRPLRKAADYARFVGEQVEIMLKLAFQGRKRYRGQLLAEGEGWRVVFSDGKVEQALDFSLEEVRDARLVPAVNFKGRKAAGADGADGGKTGDKAAGKKTAKKKQSNAKARQQPGDEEEAAAPAAADKDDKVDGGLDQ